MAQYGELLGMEEPRLNLYGGDYDIYGRQLYRLEFFEGDGSDLGQILHYNFTPSLFIATMRVGFSWCGSGRPTCPRKWGITLSS